MPMPLNYLKPQEIISIKIFFFESISHIYAILEPINMVSKWYMNPKAMICTNEYFPVYLCYKANKN